jgi:DNA-binding transcriptional MerR regulator
MEYPDLIRPRDAAELTGVRVATLRLWAEQGLIAYYQLCGSNHRRYFRAEIEMLAALTDGPLTAAVIKKHYA